MNTHESLLEMARRTVAHAKARTTDQVDSILRVPVANYTDEARWQREVDLVFKRLPLLVATSAELRATDAYKAVEVCGVPLLLTRSADGVLRGFVNTCSHRGAQLVAPGTGSARRFTCPYHAWTYDQTGDLVGMFKREEFGELDWSGNGLSQRTVIERAGLIWVVLAEQPSVEPDAFFAGYDELLACCRLEDMNLVGSRTLVGPNWKIAFDGYVDFYHLPILHKDTFGPKFPSEAVFHRVGVHQRVTVPRGPWETLDEVPEAEWPESLLTSGVWSVFPHASIAGFSLGDHLIYQVARLYPGARPSESVTVLDFLTNAPLTDDTVATAERQIAFLERVVRDEDYATGLGIQRGLETGARQHVLFGRNEVGAQHVHRWLDAILATPDDRLSDLFRAGAAVPNPDRS